MYIQCSRCNEPTWIRSLVPGLVDAAVKCPDCGHEHDLSRADELGETGKEQYELATEFANRNSVELPTAYSILLGLMTLQEARDLAAAVQKEKQREKTAAAEPAADEPALGVDRSVLSEATPLDEGDAVVLLSDTDEPDDNVARPTPRPSAAPRRQHSNAARHRRARPRSKDNVTIHVARDMAKERLQLTGRQIGLIIVLASLTLGLSGRHAYRTWQGLVEEGKTAQRNTVASAEAIKSAERKALAKSRKNQADKPNALEATVLRDAENRITQVIAANPMIVLTAYCTAASATHEQEPLELAQASPPTPDERVGIFRDFSRLEANRAIHIRQDREAQRWIAGDGITPLESRLAPPEPDTIRRASNDPR